MPTLETLKILDLLTSKLVELAYVVLFARIARLTADFLRYRLDVLGTDARIFVPRDEDTEDR